jgi:hypothetical protein
MLQCAFEYLEVPAFPEQTPKFFIYIKYILVPLQQIALALNRSLA